MLSLPDCFALSCATRPDHILVSGDLDLRNEAVARIGQLFEGLTKIYAHLRCRLPQPLIKARLKAKSEG